MMRGPFLAQLLSLSLPSLSVKVIRSSAEAFPLSLSLGFMSQEKGQPLPKFGEWDVNDPASAEGFTVIFNKARDEKKTGGKPESPGKVDPQVKQHTVDPRKPPPTKKWFCCIQSPAES